MIKTRFLRARTLPILAAGLIGLTSPAKAEMPIAPRQPDVQAIKSVAGTGAARFDWLARRDTSGSGKVTRVKQRVALGRGSWICSPAGFNRKSSCFRR